jgi:hypothetical protein
LSAQETFNNKEKSFGRRRRQHVDAARPPSMGVMRLRAPKLVSRGRAAQLGQISDVANSMAARWAVHSRQKIRVTRAALRQHRRQRPDIDHLNLKPDRLMRTKDRSRCCFFATAKKADRGAQIGEHKTLS